MAMSAFATLRRDKVGYGKPMDKFHRSLLKQSKSYASWHKGDLHVLAHWVFFSFTALFLTSSLITSIELSSHFENTSNAKNPIVLTAASINSYEKISELPVATSNSKAKSSDQILVKFKANVGQQKKLEVLQKNNLMEKYEISQIGVKILKISENDTAEEAVARLISGDDADVEFAEVDALVYPDFIPNDRYFSSAWHHNNIESAKAWDTNRGEGVIVAILDTGVNPVEDLSFKLLPGWNFYDNNSNSADVNGHGTAVAGIVGAMTDNTIGVSSIAYNSQILPVRISQPDGSAFTSTISQGLTYAADSGARVANISYGVTNSSTVSSAAQYFESKGGVVTVSAGNDGTLITTGENPNLITVSATEASDFSAKWSTFGKHIDVGAPGTNIITTLRTGAYSGFSGTSAAAPVTAGVAALIISTNPSINASQVLQILQHSSDDMLPVGWDVNYGWGRVNAARAVECASTFSCFYRIPGPISDTVAPSMPTNLTITPINSGTLKLAWATSTDNNAVAGYFVYFNGQFDKNLSKTQTTSSIFGISTTPGAKYTYTVKAYDANGNFSALSEPLTYTVGSVLDTQSPSASIVSPISDSTVSDIVPVNVNAADNVSVTRVDLWKDNSLLATKTVAPYTFNWDTTKDANGTHTLQAQAFDAVGNVGNSSIVSVAVSNTEITPDPTPTSSATPAPAAVSITSFRVATKTANTATIVWTTNVPSIGSINYGTTNKYGSELSGGNLGTSHSMTITGLSKSTKYFFQIKASDGQNVGVVSSTFRTTNK